MELGYPLADDSLISSPLVVEVLAAKGWRKSMPSPVGGSSYARRGANNMNALLLFLLTSACIFLVASASWGYHVPLHSSDATRTPHR